MADDFTLPGWVAPTALGLGGVSDIFGAYSRYQQARKMDAIRKMLQDPAALARGGLQTAGFNNPDVMRLLMQSAQIDPSLRGVFSGGAYNQYIADALAKQYGTGVNQYIQALTGAAGTVPQATGGGGGFGSALQTLAFLRMMQDPKTTKTTGQDPGFTSGLGGFDYQGWMQNPNVNWGQFGELGSNINTRDWGGY